MSETTQKRGPGRPPKALEPTDTRDRLSYTVDEAAAATGVSAWSIWKLVREGELTTFKFAGRTLIRADVLEAAIDRASGRKACDCYESGVAPELCPPGGPA